VSIRVFLLDDHPLVREGIRTLLESDADMEVVGEASTAAEALSGIATTRPDVAILDVRLADGNGIDVCRDVRSLMPDLACLMLTSFADDEALYASIMAGSAGYVLKQLRGRDLVGDVKKVAGGGSLLDARLVALLIDRITDPLDTNDRFSALSAEERRMLGLIAVGKTNRQISSETTLPEDVVRQGITTLITKLSVPARPEAALQVT
jgi:two-component system response regulator DevR